MSEPHRCKAFDCRESACSDHGYFRTCETKQEIAGDRELPAGLVTIYSNECPYCWLDAQKARYERWAKTQ